VDDNDLIGSLVQEFLVDQNYVVLVATDGLKALELAASYERPVDLLLTDLEMPGMSGLELAANLKTIYPALSVLFMSGRAEGPSDETDESFLPKPFGRKTLLHKVRATLR